MGWLTKLVAVFAVVGVLVFDGASLGVAELGAADQAAAASRAAADELDGGGTPQGAYDAAWSSATAGSSDVTLPAEMFVVTADGTVTLTLERTVSTLVLHRVPGSERWLTVSATSTHRSG